MNKIRNQALIMVFGKNVQRIRLFKGFTQEYLAEEAGISQVQIARIESGKLNSTISTVASLACALNVQIGDLFLDQEQD
jgi:transcriptional regulator with XRE-family HTH domain